MTDAVKYNYNFDENGVFAGASVARLDPLESAAQRRDIYLVPANSTAIEPLPLKEGFNVVFDTESQTWSYQSISGE